MSHATLLVMSTSIFLAHLGTMLMPAAFRPMFTYVSEAQCGGVVRDRRKRVAPDRNPSADSSHVEEVERQVENFHDGLGRGLPRRQARGICPKQDVSGVGCTMDKGLSSGGGKRAGWSQWLRLRLRPPFTS